MAILGGVGRGSADPSLTSTVTNLGNGLYAVDLFVSPNDALNGSMALEVELSTVAGGAFIHSSPTSPFGLSFNAGSPDVDRKSVGQNITTIANDPSYNQALDSWWDDTVWIQQNPPYNSLTGATGGQAGSSYYAFSAGSGGGSMITGTVALGRMIVRDPILFHDSVLSRAGVDYLSDGYIGATDYKLWNNAAGGTFQTGPNWLLPGAPGATDDAVFSLSSNYTVDFTGAASTERLLVRQGQVTFDLNGSSYAVVGAGAYRNFVIGDYAGDNGSLTITDGALSSGTAAIAEAVGSSGALTIGAGGLLNNPSSTVLVGDRGNGAFTIQSGGDAVTKNVQVGNQAGATGALTISGVGSTLNNNTELNIGHGGAGTMTVSAGATLTNAAGYLGRLSNVANGSATVTGAGSLWTNTGLLHVGELGSGSLSVLAGGVVTSPTGQLASQTGSTGSLTIDGANSRWTVATTMEVGTRGMATATLSNGGRLESATGIVGTQANSSGSVAISGANSRWTNSGELRVGGAGQGSLAISAGGQATAANSTLGNSSGASGMATVGGTGSSWTTSNTLSVGLSGSGSLGVESGAQVSSLISYLGRNAGSVGTGSVTGANSVWSSTNAAWVGNSGQGTLNVSAGGRFTVSDALRIAEQTGSQGNVTVSGVGSMLTVNDYLEVVSRGTGSLEINSGATASAVNAIVGEFAGGNGGVTVTGAGSLMTLSGRIEVGTFGGGALTISNGGRLVSPNSFVGRFVGSTGTALVTGANSRWEHSGVLYVGGTTNAAGGNGSVTVANGGLVTTGDSVIVWSTGSVALNGGSVTTSTFDNQGAVTGAGLVDSIFFNNAGTLAPGASAGLLTVDANFTQTAAGSLDIELGGTAAGTGYDRLAVVGPATLAGSLDLSLINGFFPSEGSFFDVLTYNSRSGAFSTVTGTNLGSLRFLVPVYQANQLRIYAPRPGDANLDGFVTGADYTLWADGFGDFTGDADFQDGDFNGDGFVTGADYTIWADYFTGLPGAPTAVPEPAGWMLALGGLAALALARGSRLGRWMPSAPLALAVLVSLATSAAVAQPTLAVVGSPTDFGNGKVGFTVAINWNDASTASGYFALAVAGTSGSTIAQQNALGSLPINTLGDANTFSAIDPSYIKPQDSWWYVGTGTPFSHPVPPYSGVLLNSGNVGSNLYQASFGTDPGSPVSGSTNILNVVLNKVGNVANGTINGILSRLGQDVPITNFELFFEAPNPGTVLQVSSTALNFGSVRLGTSSALPLSVSNTGGGNGLTGSFGAAAGEFGPAAAESFGPLSAGAGAARNYAYAPTNRGPDNTTIAVTSNATIGNPNATVNLSGTGVGPDFDASRAPGSVIDLDISLVAATSQGLTVSNVSSDDDVGNAALTNLTLVDVAKTGADAGSFAVANLADGQVLAKGQSPAGMISIGPSRNYRPRTATLTLATDEGAALGGNGADYTYSLFAAPRSAGIWQSLAGGAWETAAHWSLGTLPSSADVARFSLEGNYTVSLAGNRSQAGVVVTNDDVLFDLNGHALNLSGALLVADLPTSLGHLTIEDGSVSAGSAFVGGTNTASGGEGLLSVAAGGTVSASGVLKVWSGGVVEANGSISTGGGLELAGGRLHGDGQVAGTLFNSGVVVPSGALDVHGVYVQAPSGTLDIELDNVSPALHVNGLAVLSGALVIDFAPGFAPDYGDVFEVLTFGSRIGEFGALEGGEFAPGRTLLPIYSATSLTLYAITPGDANGDGYITPADYTIWADNFGSGPGATILDGDFNLNGFVDGADYTVWADNYTGLPDGATLAATAVPEPAGLACLTIGLGSSLLLRRTMRGAEATRC